MKYKPGAADLVLTIATAGETACCHIVVNVSAWTRIFIVKVAAAACNDAAQLIARRY